MRRFAWIVTLPIIAIVTVFAVMNRQEVALDLWPLPWDFAVPVFLLTLLLILLRRRAAGTALATTQTRLPAA